MNNRHLKIGSILLAILILAGLIALASWYSKPKDAEAFIKSEIVNAGYCNVDTDCEALYAPCPFGCYAPVNKKESARIEGLMRDFRESQTGSMCEYGCIQIQGVACVQQKCQIVQ